jgi:hypothetical protein
MENELKDLVESILMTGETWGHINTHNFWSIEKQTVVTLTREEYVEIMIKNRKSY